MHAGVKALLAELRTQEQQLELTNQWASDAADKLAELIDRRDKAQLRVLELKEALSLVRGE